jgi:VPDSG-CTERM motif
MKLSKTVLAIVAAVAAMGFACQQAQATQITGMLNIAGTATFNTNSLGSATSVTAFNNVTVGGENTGAFTGIAAGTSVAMTSPYIFNPSTGTPMLWSVGGFVFDLQSSQVDFQSNTFLAISGAGTIFGPGFDPTPGVWAFTSQNAGGHPHTTFTFSANVAAVPQVPDSGMTVALLGAGLVGLAAFRARFAKSS